MPDHNWQSIVHHETRLSAAEVSSDSPEILGKSKELVEAIAKIVCNQRGKGFSGSDSFTTVVARAHHAVNRSPKTGSETDQHLRAISTSMSKCIEELNKARNAGGTGHGRHEVPHVSILDARVACSFARTWAVWILGCLGESQRDDVGALVRDLQSETFGAGSLKNDSKLWISQLFLKRTSGGSGSQQHGAVQAERPLSFTTMESGRLSKGVTGSHKPTDWVSLRAYCSTKTVLWSCSQGKPRSLLQPFPARTSDKQRSYSIAPPVLRCR
jgi:Abortive infection C-terminus